LSPSRILIRNACVVTLDPGIGDFARADVLVEGDKIAAVGPDLEVGEAEVWDGTYRIVLPGFVDAHRHTWQTTMRNLNSDMTFVEYFTRLLPAIGFIHRPEDMYAGTLVGALEALDAGVTTLVDYGININTPEHSDAVVEALLEAGVRGFFAHGVPSDLSWWRDSDKRHPSDAERVRARWFPSDGGLLRFAMALRGPERVTPETNRADFDFARSLGAPITLHVDAAVASRACATTSAATPSTCTAPGRLPWSSSSSPPAAGRST
jgi:cytosine/adenosine deaminase-related metal-dependent hydrolase